MASRESDCSDTTRKKNAGGKDAGDPSVRGATTPKARHNLVMVGAGPAGLAPLFAAATVGRLPELLDQGVTIVEQSARPGAGDLRHYAVASDSTADTFLDIVQSTTQPELRALREHPAARALQRIGKNEAPLALAAELLQAAGEVLCRLVASSRHGRVFTDAQAISLRQRLDGSWVTRIRHAQASQDEELLSRRVLLATGAHQPVSRLLQERVGGVQLLPAFGNKLVQSGVVLAHGGAEIVRQRLRGRRDPRIAIIGGSTSAAAAAVMLLRDLPDIRFETGAIQVLHRSPIRLCHGSVAEAIAAGDTNFVADDVCPLTQKVNRFSGLRLASRDLFLRAQGLGTQAAERRLQLVALHELSPEAVRHRLEKADLIIAAFGYRPLLLPIIDAEGYALRTHEPTRDDWAVVDEHFRVRTFEGGRLDGVYASGLAVGPVPDRGLGGEAGFRGQVNSLWMWQHNQGLRLLEELLPSGSHVSSHEVEASLPFPLSQSLFDTGLPGRAH